MEALGTQISYSHGPDFAVVRTILPRGSWLYLLVVIVGNEGICVAQEYRDYVPLFPSDHHEV